MADTYRIVLYRSGTAIPASFAEFLLTHKHAVQEVFETEELLDAVQKTLSPVLVCSDPGIASERRLLLQFLLNLGTSIELPLIWVGEMSPDFEIALGGCFPGFVRIGRFESNQKVAQAIEDLIKSFGDRWKEFRVQAQVDRKSSPVVPSAAIPAEAPPSAPKSDIPFFHTDHLFGPIAFEALQRARILPRDPKLQSEMKQVVDQFQRLDQMHILRSGYMGMQIAQSVALQPDTLEATQAASLLFTCEFPKTSFHQVLNSGFSLSGSEIDKSIGEYYQKSARHVLQKLSREPVADVIHAAGQILQSREAPQDDALHMAASTLLIGDLSNRSSFQRVQFAGTGAKTFLEKARKGQLDLLHPRAVELGVSFLAQALAARMGTSKAPAQTLGENARHVGLVELKPGMLLIQPICTATGTVLLESDTRLDRDLIMRIWQMASVTRLTLPCLIDVRSM